MQIGLALPMVVYFHRVGISGLSANAFVVPLMGLTVPAGFVAVFTGWVWVARLAGGFLWLSQRVVAWHAALEPNWRIPPPPVWLGLALAAALIAAALSADAGGALPRVRRSARCWCFCSGIRSRPTSVPGNWR